MKEQMYNTAHRMGEGTGMIFLPFGEWAYRAGVRQRLDRAHGEAMANELAARVAAGDPGIPVYQGHPDVPELAARYPDKGAFGWVRRFWRRRGPDAWRRRHWRRSGRRRRRRARRRPRCERPTRTSARRTVRRW